MDQARDARNCLAVCGGQFCTTKSSAPPLRAEGEQGFRLPQLIEKLTHSLEPESHLSAFKWTGCLVVSTSGADNYKRQGGLMQLQHCFRVYSTFLQPLPAAPVI